MAQVGRPRALDEIKRREVCALVAAGCGIEFASRYIGCSARTIRREALRNEDFHEQFAPRRTLRAAQSPQSLAKCLHHALAGSRLAPGTHLP